MEIQKKWFIYVQDHHEGPFNVEDVFQKQKSNLVTDETYVWCEGMADWQMITQVSDLYRDLQNKQNITQAKSDQNLSSFAKPETTPPESAKEGKGLGFKLAIAFGTAIILSVISVGVLSALSRSASEDLHAKLRPTFSRTVERFPFLMNAIKLTPPLTDVKPEDLKELEAAMAGAPEVGVKLGIALSTADANRPFFYIGSNLPHGTKLDILLIGNGETLLNKLQFSTQTNAVLNHNFTKSDVILGDGAQPIPKGEYKIYVTESNEQDDSIKNQLAQLTPVKAPAQGTQVPADTHFLFTKVYFLGGERDQTYLTRLKAFHDKIRENAEKELQELKQYTETLALQFTQLTNDFSKIYSAKKLTPAIKANWKKSITQWQQIGTQLDQTMQTWTKETLSNEYFYGKLYEIIKGTRDSLKKLFDLEDGFINQPTDRASFAIQQGKAYSEAQEAVELLRSKMNLMINAPKTPSGLPTREGL